MNINTEKGTTSYCFRVACAADRKQIMHILNEFFYLEEPLNKYLLEYYGNYQGNAKLRLFSDEELADPTVVAVSDGGKIVGVCLNRILIKGVDDSDLYKSKIELRQKFLDFLKHIESQSKFFDYFPNCDKGMTVDIISVDSAFSNRGIATALLRETG